MRSALVPQYRAVALVIAKKNVGLANFTVTIRQQVILISDFCLHNRLPGQVWQLSYWTFVDQCASHKIVITSVDYRTRRAQPGWSLPCHHEECCSTASAIRFNGCYWHSSSELVLTCRTLESGRVWSIASISKTELCVPAALYITPPCSSKQSTLKVLPSWNR